MNIDVRKSFERIGVVAALIFAACALATLSTPVAGAASSDGFHLYSWGGNASGQLGQGDYGAGTERTTPTRIGAAGNWVTVAAGGSTMLAINVHGHLYAWGADWTAPQMGQGAHPNPGTGFVTVPTRIGAADNWVSVAARGSTAAAINSEGHLYVWGVQVGNDANVPTRVAPNISWRKVVVTTNMIVAASNQGHLYTWGNVDHDMLGRDFTIIQANVPGRVSERSDWADVAIGSSSVIALTEGGELYSWGSTGGGRLGRSVSVANPNNRPGRIGSASNWISVGATTGAAAVAVNSDGEIYTWGNPDNGQLGRTATDANPNNRPGRVGTASNWIFVTSANSHFLALNDDYELWSWGNNHAGQLGLGHSISPQTTPQFVLQTYGFSGAAKGGGTHSIMLLHTSFTAPELTLTKDLQKPTGTSVPNTTFSFTFTPHSFNNNTTNLTPLPPIPARTITIDDTSTSNPNSPTTGITTTASSIDALADIEFTQPGIYAWTITEVQSATGVGANSSVVFSQASYRLRLYIAQEEGIGAEVYIYAVTIHRLTDTQGTAINPPLKVDDITFTNIYTRTTTGTNQCPGALTISKTVTGNFADMTTPFDFQVTLTRTPFCPPATEFVGRVVDISNNPVYTTGPSPEPRVYTFANATTRTVTLTHNQRLVFDSLLVGTRFNVTELASTEFIASVALQVDGQAVPIDPNTVPNTNLPIGNHYLGTQGNSAAFTNNHHFIPPTGLSIANSTSALPLFLATVATLAILTHKARRRVEEVPTLN